MNYKAKLRIPTEMYAFVEVEVEGTPTEIATAYREFTKEINGGEGIPTKEFNNALDQYLKDGTGLTEIYLSMSKPQQAIFQEIKKSIKRLKYNENEDNSE